MRIIPDVFKSQKVFLTKKYEKEMLKDYTPDEQRALKQELKKLNKLCHNYTAAASRMDSLFMILTIKPYERIIHNTQDHFDAIIAFNEKSIYKLLDKTLIKIDAEVDPEYTNMKRFVNYDGGLAMPLGQFLRETQTQINSSAPSKQEVPQEKEAAKVSRTSQFKARLLNSLNKSTAEEPAIESDSNQTPKKRT